MNCKMNTPTGTLAAFLQNPEEMIKFKFYDLTDLLVEMWREARNPLRKHFIDYVIITAINQKGCKGITRQQYVELTYLLMPVKVEKSSKKLIENHENISGFFDYL